MAGAALEDFSAWSPGNENTTERGQSAAASKAETHVNGNRYVPPPSRAKPRLDTGDGDELHQKLSRINGAINKMSREQMQARLKDLKLNQSGCKDVLKKRLKNFYKQQRLAQINKPSEEVRYDYLVVIDFEATCSETNENFIHEIIEFPAVLIDIKKKAVCNVFQRFCKPRINPILTDFCTQLTGISQVQVDRAKDFKEVFKEFEEWMAIHHLGTDKHFAILTDGPWDMARFLKTQVDISQIEFPKWAKQWINLRKVYCAFYCAGRVNLQHMLSDLGMTFQGRPHCGLDDSRNIAEIAIRLMEDGCLMRVNEYLHEDKKTGPQQNSSPPRRSTQQNSSPPRRSTQQNSSPPKSRLTLSNKPTSAFNSEIPQEGDDVSDLLMYMRIQKS